jgi:hypothetical protein
MPWTRSHLDRLAKLQQQVQTIVAEAGTDAPGAEWLIEANESLTAAQGVALTAIEAAERHADAMSFVNALVEASRPYAQIEEGQ